MGNLFSNKLTFLILSLFFIGEIRAEELLNDSALQKVHSLEDTVIINTLLKDAYSFLDSRNETSRAIAILCLSKSKEIGYSNGEAEAHVLLGRVYRRMAGYEKAVTNYILALKLYETMQNHYRMASVCNDLAIIHLNLKEYGQVLRFGKRALNEIKLSRSTSLEGAENINNLIGAAYFELNKFDSASLFFNNALKLSEKAEHHEGTATALANLSKVYRATGRSRQAIELIEKAIQIRMGARDFYAVAHSLGSAAQLYMDNGDFKKASILLRQAKTIADSLHDIELTVGTLHMMYDFYKRTGKFKEALMINELLVAHHDSTDGVEKNRKIKELETLYQTQRKENENTRLKKENAQKEIDLLNIKLQQRTMTVVIFFLLIMAITIVVTLYRQNVINQRLKKLNAEKNNIMAVLSHDLKSPFTRLHTYLQNVEMKVKDSESKEDINRMKELIHESGEMVQNLLDVTYLEEREVNINISEIDIYETSMMLLNGFRPSANRKNITLSLNVEVKELVFHTDAQKFKRIIDNLLSNAIKYSNYGKNVYVGVTDKDSGILISIKDEGQGMDEEDTDVLFTKFARLKSVPTGGESSTGMGLFIVKKLCESLSGKVWCESSIGAGSTFYVYLPVLSFTTGDSESGAV